MILLVCESSNLQDPQSSQYIAFFPSRETPQTRETRTDIFARSESHFPQNSHEENCETRLAVNPSCNVQLLSVCMEGGGMIISGA
jgi:hypothetical protein